MPFANRLDAGRRLADAVARLTLESPVVVALPRGGVPVAAEVAARLRAPLDVLVVRKLGSPWQPELGVGAISEGDVRLVNESLIARLGVDSVQLEQVAAREREELQRRVARYRDGRPAVPVAGRTVVLVDDGLATGFTARTAVEVLRRRGAGKVVLAVPVAPAEAVAELRRFVDEVVCLETPEAFFAIGEWYADFGQTSDAEVVALLARHAQPATGDVDPLVSHEVRIFAGSVRLSGTLTLPPTPVGVVVFAHGSGSSRLSPRNFAVARTLNTAGLATLLFDLLDPSEAIDRGNVFDIELLAARLVQATSWLRARDETAELPVGYFGASTGAAAALVAAARLGERIDAVVARGGRPDLAAAYLRQVRAPTLLIVGGRDETVLKLNEQAAKELRCPTQIEVVAGATHLFEEPGALELVAELARDWFTSYLRPKVRSG